jgi:hypothetical protein
MKRTILVLAVACCVAVPSASAAFHLGSPSPAAATAALGNLLHGLYGPIAGVWTCPQSAHAGGRLDCFAEVHRGRRWHELSVSAFIRRGVIVFTTLTREAAQTWTRGWSHYSRRYLLRFREPAPGIASVNSSSSFYDWGWIARGARSLESGQTRRVGANDAGPIAGFERFLVFSCSRRGGLITCRNALGDAMRYRPAG